LDRSGGRYTGDPQFGLGSTEASDRDDNRPSEILFGLFLKG
jgi:hypothetical protein